MAWRKIQQVVQDGHKVVIQWSGEWEEYRVRIYPNGVLNTEADTFESDELSAIDTMYAQLKWLVNNG